MSYPPPLYVRHTKNLVLQDRKSGHKFVLVGPNTYYINLQNPTIVIAVSERLKNPSNSRNDDYFMEKL